ncbi:hypothetical protein QBE52_05935 [Clostridiaceae bacterium 35-E11]
MKVNVHEIKKIADQIERVKMLGNRMMMKKLLDDMIGVCHDIKRELEETEKINESMKLQKINLIPFIYKPILKKNYYEGTYLEEFAHRRTADLKEANALDIHNKFWQTHEVLRGNVFGSMPVELITNNAIHKLQRLGWDKVKVNILEIQERKCSMKEMVVYCEMNYRHFLIVNEKSTGAELVLHYDV